MHLEKTSENIFDIVFVSSTELLLLPKLLTSLCKTKGVKLI